MADSTFPQACLKVHLKHPLQQLLLPKSTFLRPHDGGNSADIFVEDNNGVALGVFGISSWDEFS